MRQLIVKRLFAILLVSYAGVTNARYVQADPVGLDGGWNRYPYVEANPLRSVDPLGLWSMTFGGYAGIGGEVSFGRDPITCQGFVSIKFGWGAGGGAKWDPRGGRPGTDTSTPARAHGVTAGFFADAELNAGPVQAALQNNFGRDFPFWYNSAPYGDFMKPNGTIGDSWGVKGTMAAGGEVSMYTASPKGVTCGCK